MNVVASWALSKSSAVFLRLFVMLTHPEKLADVYAIYVGKMISLMLI